MCMKRKRKKKTPKKQNPKQPGKKLSTFPHRL